ncbi:hypothetical protein A2870_04140 [Candidatus Curtissbacteria bacterium RIFCSPHIGHO2_01_FULL_41_11]|uniref:Uncharacterized protein n=1 Tax=Candidatus Curtissbacteria bacterium RIFCSPHIGHO2_01_FULL_41_11 TaxID=1797711 RepID=A0A1F5G6P0_9BACT|nr:MAG: hypothetical protein A2870_04140 [Candidatus Curtissbacteria bacterium RIFCSPHIGHO2_01_FULL_41_11]
MVERVIDSSPTDTLIRPKLSLFEKRQPGFSHVIRELDQECIEVNGHGLFWRLFLDRLHSLELGKIAELVGESNREHHLPLVDETLEEALSAVQATKKDPRFAFSLGVPLGWQDRDIELAFAFLKFCDSRERAMKMAGNIYTIIGEFLPEEKR